MPIDPAVLRKLAEAATPGVRTSIHTGDVWASGVPIVRAWATASCPKGADFYACAKVEAHKKIEISKPDHAFILATSPQTILALLTIAEKAKAMREALRDNAVAIAGCLDVSDLGRCCTELDAALKEIG